MKLSVAYAVREEVGFEVLVEAPLEKVLDMLVELGYSGIELNIANPMKFDVPRYRQILRDRGIAVSAISTGLSYLTYRHSLSHPNEEMRRKAIEFMDRYSVIAHELECDRVVIGLIRGPGDNRESMNRLIDSLNRVLDIAEKHNVTILLEPLNRYETKLINNIDQFIELYNTLGKPKNLRMLFDTFHMTLEERDPYTAILKAKNYIGYVHLAENNRLAPGMGMIDWTKIIALLRAIGYNYYLSIECIPKPSFEEMLRIASKTIKPLIESIAIP